MSPFQLEAARNLLMAGGAEAELASLMGPDMADALRTLLTATAPSSEEELTRQGRAWLREQHAAGLVRDEISLVDAYIAGARREGRKVEAIGRDDGLVWVCDCPTCSARREGRK